MGPRRISTTSNASGSWLLDEQCDAQRAGIWPFSQSADPYFSDVSLLLHMDGSNGSTTFTDSSSNALSVTAAGGAQITTSNVKFGTGALGELSGPKRLEIAGTSLLSFPADFTVEVWARPDAGSLSSVSGILEIGSYDNGVFIRSYSPTSDTVYVNGTSLGDISSHLTANTYSFIQITRTGTSVSVNVDGIARLSGTVSGTVNSTSAAMKVGVTAPGGGTEYFAGNIDEVRVTKGIARANVVPTAAFPDS
jgi:hypothetical protein